MRFKEVPSTRNTYTSVHRCKTLVFALNALKKSVLVCSEFEWRASSSLFFVFTFCFFREVVRKSGKAGAYWDSVGNKMPLTMWFSRVAVHIQCSTNEGGRGGSARRHAATLTSITYCHLVEPCGPSRPAAFAGAAGSTAKQRPMTLQNSSGSYCVTIDVLEQTGSTLEKVASEVKTWAHESKIDVGDRKAQREQRRCVHLLE